MIHHFNIWNLGIGGDAGGQRAGHRINIIQVASPETPGSFRFCVYEPQSDEIVACWRQASASIPSALPGHVVESLQAFYRTTHPAFAHLAYADIFNRCERSGNPPATFSIEGMATRFQNRTGYTDVGNWGMGTPP